MGDAGPRGPEVARAAMVGDELAAAALCSLPGMTPARLCALLTGRNPADAWAALVAGKGPRPGASPASRRTAGGLPWRQLVEAWSEAARRLDLSKLARTIEVLEIRVLVAGSSCYPEALASDPQPPPVLFGRGQLRSLDQARVAIVGTRSATPYGREVAASLGAGLAAAGVAVVSGLALGIDGAAHEGALGARAAPPIAVVGSGLDVVYPPSHARLWERVAGAGCLLSEAPLGARPEPWRFPWRNRVIAALSQVVVIVESHASGGALLTAEAAARRCVPVLAVPGSVRSPASVGTNALLADGCAPARDVEDVLVALGMAHQRSPEPAAPPGRRTGRSSGPGALRGASPGSNAAWRSRAGGLGRPRRGADGDRDRAAPHGIAPL